MGTVALAGRCGGRASGHPREQGQAWERLLRASPEAGLSCFREDRLMVRVSRRQSFS